MGATNQQHHDHDLRCYSPSLLLDWPSDPDGTRHRGVEGTLVFADVSGFTRLSEALHKAGGKIGAEQMTDVIGYLFGELLLVAAARGGEMLKYGGDAVLLFFTGEDHPLQAVAACHEMQRRLHEIGRVDTGAGVVRLKMSVGVHTGRFDFFRVGSAHVELVIAGPDTTTCVEMEAAAEATEVLCSPATVAAVGDRWFGKDRAGGRLLARKPRVSPAALLTVDDMVSQFAASSDPGQFLSPTLRTFLGQGTVESDHRLAAVGFLHIMGIDRLLVDGDAEAAAEALHATVTCVQEALAAYDVTFLATDLAPDGTKVMIAAGAPYAVNDDAGRMLLALRQIIESEPPLPVRAGANRGHVFSGAVGPPFRRAFTTMGDVTNTAARVMGKAEPGQVLTLQSVVSAAVPVFDIVEGEPFMAKGKAEPLVPFAIGPRRRAESSTTASSTPLLGRDSELAELQGFLANATAGATTGVDLVAEPGMGRGRLLQQLRADSQTATWLVHACDPYETDTAFASVRHLVSSAVGEGEAALREAVTRDAPDLIPWLPLVAAPLGVTLAPTTQSAGLTESQAAAKTVQALAELLASTSGRPLVLSVESAEWIDAASAEVLRTVLELPDRQLLVITSRRADSDAILKDAAVVELGPLDASASEAIVRRLFGNEILTRDLELLVARGHGNPFFLRELARAFRSGETLPDTLESLLATRIDRLDKETRDALRCAAVIGVSIDPRVIEELIGHRAEHLSETGLISADASGTLHFQHSLIRDVAYEGLAFRRRRDLHQRVGLLLEERADDPDEVADTLSLHFLLARDGSRSWQYAVGAAEKASRLAAHSVAGRLYRRALEARRYGAAPTSEEVRDIWIQLGHAEFWSGDLTAAVTAFRSARRMASGDAAILARLQFMEGEIADRRGDLAAARRWFRQTQGSLADLDTPEARKWRIRALTSDGVIELRRGQYRRAIERSRTAAGEAKEAGDLAGEAHALQLHYLAATRLGLEGRRSLADRALVLFGALDPPDIREQANLLNNLGLDAQQDGDLEGALNYFTESRKAQEAAGNTVAAAAVDNNIGEIYLEQGRLAEAEALFERAEGVFLAAGSWFAHVATANRGTLALRADRIDEGVALLERALAAAREAGLKPLIDDFEHRLQEHASSS